ncbi:NADPH-dependent FMN reductase [Luteolibacter soli]|uniref:NADPH-dependent FMN reductase n=1 Tax=Luteolibacter soli TaxID=3135280 RepID=A0ABU9AWF7_9BACT
MTLRVLTLCGSLRARSSNRAMLLAYERAAPDMAFTHYAGIGELPHFNPDLDGEGKPVPSEVAGLRDAVAGADALVISTPEYVHALPGAFKNALDWLVSDPAFIGKPVVILHRAHGSSWALESLREVLRTMSAEVIEDATALLPLETNQIDETAILARDDLRLLLLGSAAALRATLDRKTNQAPV